MINKKQIEEAAEYVSPLYRDEFKNGAEWALQQTQSTIDELVKALYKGVVDIEKRQELCLDKHRYEKLESLKEGIYFSLGLINESISKVKQNK